MRKILYLREYSTCTVFIKSGCLENAERHVVPAWCLYVFKLGCVRLSELTFEVTCEGTLMINKGQPGDISALTVTCICVCMCVARVCMECRLKVEASSRRNAEAPSRLRTLWHVFTSDLVLVKCERNTSRMQFWIDVQTKALMQMARDVTTRLW